MLLRHESPINLIKQKVLPTFISTYFVACPAGSVRACQRGEKRKAVQSGCIKFPPLKKIKAYNLRIRSHEQDHVKVSKAKNLVNQGVLDPGFILQLQHTAHKASYPVGAYREEGGGIEKRRRRGRDKKEPYSTGQRIRSGFR
ncbi:hypothetical protein AAMO2058_000421200 [Amorphochlora amoebiformis]